MFNHQNTQKSECENYAYVHWFSHKFSSNFLWRTSVVLSITGYMAFIIGRHIEIVKILWFLIYFYLKKKKKKTKICISVPPLKWLVIKQFKLNCEIIIEQIFFFTTNKFADTIRFNVNANDARKNKFSLSHYYFQ